MTARLEIWGVDGLPEVAPGDDVAKLLLRCPGLDLQTGDILVITSKIVSKAQGRLVPGTREDHLAAETRRVVARRGETTIVETRDGFVMAAAGIDASNVPDGMVALLPTDPDRAAAEIRETLRADGGVDVAVIISDTMGRPWRDGIVDSAIGAAGLDVMWDLRGQRDAAGHLLEATVIAIADELASAADLVKGKIASTPVAVIRGFPFVRSDLADLGARPLIRPSAEDMFRLGTREAMHQVVVDAVRVDVGDDSAGHEVDGEGVARAVDVVRSADVELVITDGGRLVSATGEPLSVGVVLGRLTVALAAEGLRCSAPEPTADGATVRIRAAG